MHQVHTPVYSAQLSCFAQRGPAPFEKGNGGAALTWYSARAPGLVLSLDMMLYEVRPDGRNAPVLDELGLGVGVGVGRGTGVGVGRGMGVGVGRGVGVGVGRGVGVGDEPHCPHAAWQP